jgi:hypothetical protein
MTDRRLAWLLAQLVADEVAAKAATPGKWTLPRLDDEEIGDPTLYKWEDEEHIVTWDPVRALAVVAALRQIVDEHAPRTSKRWCQSCDDELGHPRPWPCRTVKAIASIYADRPGYAEVWGGG